MKNDKNFKKGKRIVKSVAQAKTVLNMLLQGSERQNLERGIFELIDKLKNPKLDLLLDKYPDLLQEYDLNELLSGIVEIKDTNIQDVKTAGLLSCLQLLLHFYAELRENPNPDDNIFDSLRYILNSITLSKFLNELLSIILSVVGETYYEKFQKKIQYLDFDLKNAKDMESDPELQEHIDLMVWFAFARLFLESVYTYFNNSQKNHKNNES